MTSERQIEVTFLEAGSDREIVRASLPAGALPERMAPPRRIELAGKAWRVVSSHPATMSRAASVGKLEVRLQELPPGTFTVPTLAEELPRFDETRPREGRLLELDGDDWRQLEFVSAGVEARVAEQFLLIEKVLAQEPPAPGLFASIHLRTQMGPPLKSTSFDLEEIASVLPPGTLRLDGVAVEGEEGVVKDGFGFLTMSGLELYGVASKGQVKAFGLRLPAEPADLGVEALGLSTLMLRHGLVLVDWPRARVAQADAASVEALLSSPDAVLTH